MTDLERWHLLRIAGVKAPPSLSAGQTGGHAEGGGLGIAGVKAPAFIERV